MVDSAPVTPMPTWHQSLVFRNRVCLLYMLHRAEQDVMYSSAPDQSYYRAAELLALSVCKPTIFSSRPLVGRTEHCHISAPSGILQPCGSDANQMPFHCQLWSTGLQRYRHCLIGDVSLFSSVTLTSTTNFPVSKLGRHSRDFDCSLAQVPTSCQSCLFSFFLFFRGGGGGCARASKSGWDFDAYYKGRGLSAFVQVYEDSLSHRHVLSSLRSGMQREGRPEQRMGSLKA